MQGLAYFSIRAAGASTVIGIGLDFRNTVQAGSLVQAKVQLAGSYKRPLFVNLSSVSHREPFSTGTFIFNVFLVKMIH